MVFKDPSLLHLPSKTGHVEMWDVALVGHDWLHGDFDFQSCSYADRESLGWERK